MKNGNKAFPEVDIEIEGKTYSLVLDYETLERWEKTTGKPAGALGNPGEIASVSNAIAVLHAALYSQDKKFTLKYVRTLMKENTQLFHTCVNKILPTLVNNCFDFSKVEDDSDSDTDEQSDEETGEKKE